MMTRITRALFVVALALAAPEIESLGSVAHAQANDAPRQRVSELSPSTLACLFAPVGILFVALIPVLLNNRRAMRRVEENAALLRRADARGEESLQLQRETVELLKELVARRDWEG
jgi:hypothetical protein